MAGSPASALPGAAVPEAEVHSVVEGALGRRLPTMSLGGRGALTKVLGSMGDPYEIKVPETSDVDIVTVWDLRPHMN